MHFLRITDDSTSDDLREGILNLAARMQRTRDRDVRAELQADIDEMLDLLAVQ